MADTITTAIERLDRDDLENLLLAIAGVLWCTIGPDPDDPECETEVWNPGKQWDVESLDSIASAFADWGILPPSEVERASGS